MLRTSPKLVTNTLKQQRSVLVGVKSRISNLYTTLASKTISSTMPAATEETNKAYATVSSKLKELDALNGISGLMMWDEMVMMPDGAAAARGNQKAALAGVVHDKCTDAELGTLLTSLAAVSAEQLDPVQAAVVRDARSNFIKSTAIPKELAQRMARLETEGYGAWVKARTSSDFSLFAPFLQQWVEINQQKAQLINPSKNSYDVLLDDFEKGMTSERLDQIFSQVRDELIPLIAQIKASPHQLSDEWLKGSYSVETQAKLCKKVALDLGFDMERGRLDVSVHPFTGGSHPTDVRITTRFKPDNLMEGLTGAIHETGHALYEQGRNQEYDGLPVNSALGMGIHESQSLLWERMVALSPPFSKYLLPLLNESFPKEFGGVSERQLYEAMNVICTPSLIRVESDEVTYPMHVILRYEIERGLMSGSIKVEDLPTVWNAKMKEYLGDVPPTDAQGVLQDVHWSSGAFGYFPTYSLGAMYATQIFDCAKKSIPALEEKMAAGDFKELKAWLNAKIHSVGSLHANGDELMVAVTGAPLDPSIFIKYLRDKYTDLYKL